MNGGVYNWGFTIAEGENSARLPSPPFGLPSSRLSALGTSRLRLLPSSPRLRRDKTPSLAAETGRSMKHTGKPVMKSALWAYESAAGGFSSIRPPRVAAHEIPPDGGTKAARCAAYSAREWALCRE